MTKLGPTNSYPDGQKLHRGDKGGLNMAVYKEHNLVHIAFGTEVSWVAFPPEQAIELAKLLMRHAGVKKVEVTL